MRRREFLAALGLLPLLPYGCERRRPALALATADTESHVAVLDAATGRVRARLTTVEEPRSIEAAGGIRAVVGAGLVFTILAVAYVVTSGPAPGLTARFGRLVVAAGGLVLTLGLGLLALAVAEVGTTAR